jgi:competence protein ComEC
MPRTAWLAIGAAVAALAASTEDRRSLAALAAVGGPLLLAALWLPRPRRTAVLAVAMGVLSIGLRAGLGPAGDTATGSPQGAGPWSMVVETVGSPRDGHQVATLRTPNSGPTGFRLAATLPRYPAIEPGDRVTVEGRTRARPDSAYGQYLDRLGAWGTLDARSMVVLGRPVDAGTLLEGWRRDAGEALTRVLPEPEAGLAAGILIGLRDRVDRQVASDFTTAGVSHVVAISGWNIAIVGAAVGAVAGRLGRRRRAVVTIVAVLSYILFAGASASVLRAGAMAGVVLLARESGRSGRAAAALGWAAYLLLLAQPTLVNDAGFQLSTLATAGLVAWATPLTERLDRLTRGRLPRWLTESLGVSLAAQAATLPVVLASFGRLAVISPVVNLLVVPLVAPAMAAGLVALLGGALVSLGAPSAVGAVLAAPGWVALRVIIGVVEVAAAVPYASVAFEPAVGAILGLAMAAAGLVVVVARRRSARRTSRGRNPVSALDPRPTRASRTDSRASTGSRTATMALVVAVTVAGAVVVTRPVGVARITVLDVGQGDAILVEGSRGGRLLIDGGPDPDRLLVELDRRIPPWDRRLDAIVLSHPHEDHVAGLALLLDRYRVGRVFEPGMRGPGPGYAAWLDRLARPGAPVRSSIAAGDRLAVDEIAMRVLWPIRGQVSDEPPDAGSGINNVSVVLLGVVGGRRFLLTGDVEQDVDPSLLTEGLPRVDFLKVAHHGSRTATTDAFLAAVRPRVAVASAGAGNPYGHPARRTLERLAATGARVYRTDVDGSVTVSFEPAGLMVRTKPRRDAAGRVRTAAAATVRAVEGPQRTFLCAIPAPAAATTRVEGAAALPIGRPGPAGAAADALDAPGPSARLGYHRVDDRPRARGCRGPALLPGSAAVVRRARASRRRGRGLPGGTDRGQWDRRGPDRGRGGGTAARRRQGPAGDGLGAGTRSRTRIRGVADETGAPGAGTGGREPPGHAPRRRGGAPTLGGLREPRRADRGLRGQAGGAASGVDGGAVRVVAPAVSRWLGRDDVAGSSRASRAPRGGCLPGGRHRAH